MGDLVMQTAFLTGLVTGLGLIVAIGAQNAFVIRAGLMRRRVFAVATVSFLCDAGLIALGVAGVGAAIAANAWLTAAAAWGGAAFLVWFGARALHNALRRDHRGLAAALAPPEATPRRAEAAAGEGTAGGSLRAAVAASLGFSLLNPHVYLDTVVVLGGIGAQYAPPGRLAFLAGGALASFLWFYGIGYGATAFTPLFRRPLTTRLLDGFVAAVMFTIALLLVSGRLAG